MNSAGQASALARFQDAFARALVADAAPADEAIARLATQPAFAVYRNTVMKGCVDALQANFPTVARIVGEEWFRAAAAIYAAQELPREASLLAYGDTFPAFVAGFPPAADLPYLADVARADRLWTEAHAAADSPALSRADLAGLDPGTLGEAILHPHPAARWAWFPDSPVGTIWRRNREESADGSEIAWHGEGLLLTRPDGAVKWTSLDAAGCRFLDACAQSLPVAQAIGRALETDAHANLVRLIASLLDAGAIGRLELPAEPTP